MNFLNYNSVMTLPGYEGHATFSLVQVSIT